MISLNGTKIEPTIFSDKTSQVWQVPEEIIKGRKQYNIEFDFDHEGEIFHLMQLVRLIRHANIPAPINLYMPYLPYGRQDKDISNDATFALSIFCDILESLSFTKITTLDAHSMKAAEYIDNFSDIFPLDAIKHAKKDSESEILAYPDAGAKIRYTDTLIYHEFVTGNKVRDQKTGWITHFNVENPHDVEIKDKTILIVDDICDGGMTFILFAKDLLKAGAKEVNLYVTHGIFSKGLGVLREAGITHIYSKDGIHI